MFKKGDKVRISKAAMDWYLSAEAKECYYRGEELHPSYHQDILALALHYSNPSNHATVVQVNWPGDTDENYRVNVNGQCFNFDTKDVLPFKIAPNYPKEAV